MSTLNLLYKHEIPINQSISVVVPTIKQIIDDEDYYNDIVSLFTATPMDMMVQLDDMGIDFSELNDFDLFILFFPILREKDTSFIIKGIDFKDFDIAINEQNGKLVLLDREHDIKIDRAIHGQIASVLRNINNIEPDRRKPANKEARDFLIERARAKQRRNKGRKRNSHIESLIVSLVNTEQFKYNYETVLDLTIYQLNQSVKQIIHKIQYDNRMIGVYSGTVDAEKLSQDDLNWLSHK